jgi:hypothetical protein
LFIAASGGCASASYYGASLAGTNVRDLEDLKQGSPSKVYDMPYAKTFDLMMEKTQGNGLTEYMVNRQEGYIIAMGLERQVNTTRIGVFIERITQNTTQVILTSKSSTALDKAQLIYFGELLQPSQPR